jgi:hypothetical protein
MDLPEQLELVEEEIAIMQGLGLLFPANEMDARDRDLRNEALRQRLRDEGFRFCDDVASQKDEPSRGWFGKRRASEEQLQPEYERPLILGPELPILGVAASSTDHETQASS